MTGVGCAYIFFPCNLTGVELSDFKGLKDGNA